MQDDETSRKERDLIIRSVMGSQALSGVHVSRAETERLFDQVWRESFEPIAKRMETTA